MTKNINDRETKEHPAFGSIQIMRTSGQTRLFKSGFNHHNYITIRISTADEVEGYGIETSIFPRKEIIEVALSEAQFARLITTPNLGSGTPCTLKSMRIPQNHKEFEGKRIPDIEAEDIRATHSGKIEQDIKDRLQELTEFQEQLRTWRKDKHRPTLAELDGMVSQLAGMHLAGNFAFLQQLLEEHMEKTVEEGRMELEAHANVVICQLGLNAAQSAQLPQLVNDPKTIEIGEE